MISLLACFKIVLTIELLLEGTSSPLRGTIKKPSLSSLRYNIHKLFPLSFFSYLMGKKVPLCNYSYSSGGVVQGGLYFVLLREQKIPANPNRLKMIIAVCMVAKKPWPVSSVIGWSPR